MESLASQRLNGNSAYLTIQCALLISVRKPSGDAIRRYLMTQSALALTYEAVGATRQSPPANYVIDHTRVELGQGERVFTVGCRALQTWKQFELGWLEALPNDTPIRAGATVAILVRAFGMWWLNAARIVYVVDESTDSFTRFGFAYGTLPGHAETGEERFFVECDRATGRIYYDIFAFSRPRHILPRLAKPLARRMQKRFSRDSAAAMRRAVQ